MRIAKITLALMAVVILVGFTAIGIKSGATTQDINYNAPRLESTEEKLKSNNVQIKQLNIELNDKASRDEKKINEQKQQMEKLQKEREDLQTQVQAKAAEKERLRIAAANAANTLTATKKASAEALPVAPPAYTGSHEGMMAAAGISPSDYAAVDYIVSHESGWNATAVNASSGSCGLIQELPCGKSGCTFGDGVCQLRWATNYATNRYGSWWGAHGFWQANRWW